LTLEAFQGGVIQAVALLQAVGDVGESLAHQEGETLGEEDGGGDTIGIEVSVDGNGLPLLQGTTNALHGRLYIGEEEGVSKETLIGSQEGFSILEAPVMEKLRQEIGELRPAGLFRSAERPMQLPSKVMHPASLAY
jgi:hypothetical protein